ncbi:MAG: phytanoyl-CoA dioxygenase [Rhodospirillaceae bacterium]|nr:phytanoyl-CoA dioxygenase [Rhodospirillaceae bacterium]|tara:strand:+ start:2174 stop:3004 length:831 start_codon:yes stop_codon:yes gene_type:complete
MPNLMTEADIAAYKRNGYHFPIRVMSPSDASENLAKLEAFERMHGGSIPGKLKIKSHLLLTWVYTMVSHPTVLDAVEDVLGPDILCWNSSFFIKNANDPAHVTWHQDSTYWGLSKPDVCSAWIALTPANEQNGVMKIIPGSHEFGQLDHEDTFAGDNLLARGQRLVDPPNEEAAVSLNLDPGEISLHHIMSVHGSKPNETDQRRIGFAIRYAAPHVRLMGNIRDSALLVRGKDRYGHFDVEYGPKTDMDSDAIIHHTKVMENRAKVKYAGTGQDYS